MISGKTTKSSKVHPLKTTRKVAGAAGSANKLGPSKSKDHEGLLTTLVNAINNPANIHQVQAQPLLDSASSPGARASIGTSLSTKTPTGSFNDWTNGISAGTSWLHKKLDDIVAPVKNFFHGDQNPPVSNHPPGSTAVINGKQVDKTTTVPTAKDNLRNVTGSNKKSPSISPQDLAPLGYGTSVASRIIARYPELAQQIRAQSIRPVEVYRGLSLDKSQFSGTHVSKHHSQSVWFSKEISFPFYRAQYLASHSQGKQKPFLLKAQVPSSIFHEEPDWPGWGHIDQRTIPDITPFISDVGTVPPVPRLTR